MEGQSGHQDSVRGLRSSADIDSEAVAANVSQTNTRYVLRFPDGRQIVLSEWEFCKVAAMIPVLKRMAAEGYIIDAEYIRYDTISAAIGVIYRQEWTGGHARL